MKQIRQDILDERTVEGGREIHLTYRLGDNAAIPAILLLPPSATAPAALLLHGYSSHKEMMTGSAGRALLRHGIASMAIDLPMHGARAVAGDNARSRNPMVLAQLWREGVADARLALKYMAARREIDRSRLALVGYSMGSFISVAIAADEPAVRAVVLAAGGDLPDDTPFAGMARMLADPIKAVRAYAGRPLLMVHGKRDATVSPQQAQRLYDAASQPKEIIWYDAGHYLPQAASDTAAEWLSRRLDTQSSRDRAS